MSLLKTNEIQNYNGSSLTLTASTVSTSAQLNTGGNISVTGSLNVSDDSTTRTNLGLGTIATQDSDSITVTGGSVTGTEIDLKSSGTTIYKSDGTTAVLSESGGVVTLNNGTIGSGVTFPAGHILQIKSSSIKGSSTSKTVTRTGTGSQLVDGLSISFTPKRADSEIIFSLNSFYITGGVARAITEIYAKNSAIALTSNNYDHSTKVSGTNQIDASNIDLNLVSTSGWTLLGRLFYRTANSGLISSADIHCSNSILPSYSIGDTLQFAVGIGNDTAGYDTTYTISGNTTCGQPSMTIFEIET